MVDIKKSIKDRFALMKEEREEKQKFQKELNKEALQKRRESYRKEYLRQATRQGTDLAKRKSQGGGFKKTYASVFQMGQPTKIPKTRVVRVAKRKSPVKKKVIRKKKKKTYPRQDSISPTQDWGFWG